MAPTSIASGSPRPTARGPTQPPIAPVGIPATLTLPPVVDLDIVYGLAEGVSEGLRAVVPRHGQSATLGRIDTLVEIIAGAAEASLKRHDKAFLKKDPNREDALANIASLRAPTEGRLADPRCNLEARVIAYSEALRSLATAMVGCTQSLREGASSEVAALDALEPVREALELQPSVDRKWSRGAQKDQTLRERLIAELLISRAVVIGTRRVFGRIAKRLPEAVHRSWVEGLRESHAVGQWRTRPRDGQIVVALIDTARSSAMALHRRVSVQPTEAEAEALRIAARLVAQGADLGQFS